MTLNFKKGEAKTVTFTIKDSSGNVVDVSNGTPKSFKIVEDVGDSALVSKTTSDFDTSNASSGEISVDLTSSDLDMAGNYLGEFKIEVSESDTDKSDYIDIYVEEAITD